MDHVELPGRDANSVCEPNLQCSRDAKSGSRAAGAESDKSQAPPAAPPAKTSSGPNAHTTTKRHKNKVVSSNCDSAPAAAGQGASGSASSNSAPSDAPATGNVATPRTANTQTNCASSKIIVKQGGTSDTSIQLAGGAGSKQTSRSGTLPSKCWGRRRRT